MFDNQYGRCSHKKERLLQENDIFNSPYYQAELIPQTKQIILKNPSPKESAPKSVRLILKIELVPGGVNATYDAKLLSFGSEEEERMLRRRINAFFIRNGFKFNNIIEPAFAYSCSIPADVADFNEEALELIYSFNHNMFEEPDEVNELNEILGRIVMNSILEH